MPRFAEALTSASRAEFAAPPGLVACIDEMAALRGITRAELLRRITAEAVMGDRDQLDAWKRLASSKRGDLERLALLGSSRSTPT